MSRTGKPTEKYIVDLMKQKETEYGGQVSDLDTPAIEQNLQIDLKTATKPKKEGEDKLGTVGSGIIGMLTDLDVSILHSTPFATIIAFGGSDAERHASQTVEPWANAAPWLASYGLPVWEQGIQRLQGLGRAWHKVLPVPQQWRRDELKEIIDRRNNAETEEERKEAKEAERGYKATPANFPIVWQAPDPRSTWPVYDGRPGVAETVEKVKLSRADIETELGHGLPDDFTDKEITAIHYANDVYVATVLEGGKKWLGLGKKDPEWLSEPWEHGLGVNPYVLIEGQPVLDNELGWRWRSSTFNARKLVKADEQILTDYCNNLARHTRTPYTATVNLEGRAAQGIEDKGIVVDEDGTTIMYAGTGWKEESGLFPTPQINPDALRFHGLLESYLSLNMMGREAQSGQTMSGQAAVTLETARQTANGRLAIPHAALENGWAQIVERHLRCVVALNKDYPEAMDEIVIRQQLSGNKGREISVTADDVKDYFHSIRGKIKLNIAINENMNVTNARQSTDPSHPLLSDVSALQRYYDHEDPLGEVEKIAEQQAFQMALQTLFATIQQRMTGGIEQMTGPDLQSLVQRAQGLPQAARQVFQNALGQNAGMMETIGRSAANANRAGRGQAMSTLTGMPSGETSGY